MVFRLCRFPDKQMHEVFLGTVWATGEVEALVLAAKQFPKRAIITRT